MPEHYKEVRNVVCAIDCRAWVCEKTRHTNLCLGLKVERCKSESFGREFRSAFGQSLASSERLIEIYSMPALISSVALWLWWVSYVYDSMVTSNQYDVYLFIRSCHNKDRTQCISFQIIAGRASPLYGIYIEYIFF